MKTARDLRRNRHGLNVLFEETDQRVIPDYVSRNPLGLRARLEGFCTDAHMPDFADQTTAGVTQPPVTKETALSVMKKIDKTLKAMEEYNQGVTVYLNDGMINLIARGLRRAKVFDCMRHRRAAEYV